MAGELFTLDDFDPFKLDLDWLPTSGWSSSGRRPRKLAGVTPQARARVRAAAKAARYAAAKTSQKVAVASVKKAAQAADPGADHSGLKTVGYVTAIAGALTEAMGAWFAADAAKDEAIAEAQNLEHASEMANLNARGAELEAQSILGSGQDEIGRLTLEAGADKADARARMAGRGIQLGVGSAAEVQASRDIIKQIEVRTISANATRAANAARFRRTNSENQSLLNRASARNVRRSGRTIRPFMAGSTSFLRSISDVASQWATDRRRGGV